MHRAVSRARDLSGMFPIRIFDVYIYIFSSLHLIYLQFCSVQKDARFLVAPCTFTVLRLRQLLSNFSRIQAKNVYNIFTDIAVQVLSDLASDCNWKPADLSDSVLQAFLLDKVPSLHTL